MSSSDSLVKWAQRKDKLFVTIEATDAKNVDVKFTDDTITVTGSGVHKVGAPVSEFKTVLKLSDKIDPAQSTHKVLGFSIQVCPIKADATKEHWGRLCSEPAKNLKNWLSVDWNLWKDEEDEIAGEKTDFGGYGESGMGGGGMPGMGGGMPGMPGMGGGPPGMGGGMDMNAMMQMMGQGGGGMPGGMGGAGGMDMASLMAQMGQGGGMPPGMGGEGDEGGDSDDEQAPPDLEDVENA